MQDQMAEMHADPAGYSSGTTGWLPVETGDREQRDIPIEADTEQGGAGDDRPDNKL